MIRPDPNNSTIAFFEDEEGTICVQKNSDRSMKSEIVGDAIACDRDSIRGTRGVKLNAIVSGISNVEILARINKDAPWKVERRCDRTSDNCWRRSHVSKRFAHHLMEIGQRAVQCVIRTEKETKTTSIDTHHIGDIRNIPCPSFYSTPRDTIIHEDLSVRRDDETSRLIQTISDMSPLSPVPFTPAFDLISRTSRQIDRVALIKKDRVRISLNRRVVSNGGSNRIPSGAWT